MTHAVRIRLRNFCLAILPAGIVFSLLLLCPLSGFSQTPSFSTHSFSYGAYNVPGLNADLNNDGYEDLIAFDNGSSVAGYAPTVFKVYLSKGNGSYSAPVSYTLPTGTYSNALPFVGDFNGDGKLDLVVQTFSLGEVVGFSTYLGNGDGTFRAPINSTVQYIYPAMAAADVNHDGKLDLLVITAHSAASLQVLFGNGDGTFTLGPVSNGNLYEVDTILTGDFDGDGNVDVATVWPGGPPPDGPAGGGGTFFEVLSGDGTGNFTVTYGVYGTGFYSNLDAADVNGDGISDLIFPTGSSLTVYYGAPNRAMQFAQVPTERCAQSDTGANSIAVADFNGDHIPDIAFADSECDAQNATRITILPGKGNNQFGFDVPVYTAASITSPVYALRGNRDTKADLAFQTSSSKTAIVTLLNTTTGNFPTCAPPNTAVGIAQCSPASGSTVNSPVNFAVGAAADKLIRKVDVWVDRKKQAEQFAGAFSNYAFLNASLPLASGSHRVSVIAYGWDNSQVSKTTTLTVKATSSCSAPTSDGVHICSPVSGSSVSSPVLVTATSKVTGTIVSTQLWVDGVKNFNAPASTTLTTSVSLKAGTHRFAVIATNTAGQKWESTVSATVK
jgi:hypothetical protein